MLNPFVKQCTRSIRRWCRPDADKKSALGRCDRERDRHRPDIVRIRSAGHLACAGSFRPRRQIRRGQPQSMASRRVSGFSIDFTGDRQCDPSMRLVDSQFRVLLGTKERRMGWQVVGSA